VIEVLDAQGRERRVERPAPGHVVNHQEERVELLQAPELGHGAGRAAVATRCDVRSRDPRQDRPKIVGVARARLVAADDGDHRGNRLCVFVQALGRDLDVFGTGGRRRRCRGGRRTRRRSGRGQGNEKGKRD
jgi:hypothetical protein